jgi:SAM-dependent methyltransferase
MQDPQNWQPSRFVRAADGWISSSDPSEVGVGSRLICDIVGDVYFRAIQTHVSGRLLDLGCGKVPFYGMYRDLVTENICVDWENTLHINRHIDQFVDLNGPLPFGNEEFDTILSTDVLEHIARPDCAWAEMARILRRGGKLLLTTPFLYWLHEEPHDYHRFSAHKLRLFCADYGLEVVELNSYGGAPEVILDMLCKLSTYRGSNPAAICVRMSQWLLRRARVQRISARTRDLFPLGYCLVARKPTG